MDKRSNSDAAPAREDEALLAAWVDGDRQASETLVRRHYRSIYLFLFNEVGSDRAADLTQATFETLCAKKVTFRGDATVRTYLFGIARWKLVEDLRQARGKAFDPMEESFEIASVTQSITSLFADGQREKLVVRALRALSLDDQLLLELKDYEGLTTRELAATYEVSRDAMSGRVTRARERLAAKVRELSSSAKLVESTLTGLDECMALIRERLADRRL
ncbi:MAG: sigma-70 family RNA polymerase sigma factor [Myxococcota bacterium]